MKAEAAVLGVRELSKKPAEELSARELNLVRRWQSYVRKLATLSKKEAKITKSIAAQQAAHQKIATKQTKLVEKIAEIEQEANKRLKESHESAPTAEEPRSAEPRTAEPKAKGHAARNARKEGKPETANA